MLTEEDCDDGNNFDSDGCSSVCKVERFYSCVTNATNTSECALAYLEIEAMKIEKHFYRNEVNITFSLEPGTDRYFDLLDWSTVITQRSHLNYDPIYEYSTAKEQLTMVL